MLLFNPQIGSQLLNLISPLFTLSFQPRICWPPNLVIHNNSVIIQYCRSSFHWVAFFIPFEEFFQLFVRHILPCSASSEFIQTGKFNFSVNLGYIFFFHCLGFFRCSAVLAAPPTRLANLTLILFWCGTPLLKNR